MKITKYYTVEETADLLRKVPLKGNNSAFPYKESTINLGLATIFDLSPCQYHVYSSVFKRMDTMRENLYIGEIFSMGKVGAVEIETGDGKKFIHMPPIVEHFHNRHGEFSIVADGTHRLYSSLLSGYQFEYCFIITHVDPQYPYYAEPIQGGWAGVKIYDTLPDNFIKRDYHPSYKSLYRDYNSVFTNIQPER